MDNSLPNRGKIFFSLETFTELLARAEAGGVQMSAHRLCHQDHEVAAQREPAVRREYQLLPSFGVAHAAEAAVFGLRRSMWSKLGGQPFAIPFSCSLQKRSFPFPLLQHQPQ